MVLWTIAATAAAIILLFTVITYRRQVKKTCRQLTFMKNHKTNLHLTSEVPFSDLNELIDNINEILEQSQEIQQTAKRKEDSFKEAITNLSHDIRTPLTSLGTFLHRSGTVHRQKPDRTDERCHSCQNKRFPLYHRSPVSGLFQLKSRPHAA